MENQMNHPESEKSISTTVGAIILILIVIIIGLVVWKFKGDMDSAVNVKTVPTPIVKIQKEVPADNSLAGTTAVQAGGTSPSATQTPIDFDKELKDLDTAAGAVDSADFGDSGLSNANLGL